MGLAMQLMIWAARRLAVRHFAGLFVFRHGIDTPMGNAHMGQDMLIACFCRNCDLGHGHAVSGRFGRIHALRQSCISFLEI